MVERDIYSGLHSVKHWPIDLDEEEDCVRAGGFVSGTLALQLAMDKIDEFYDDLQQLTGEESDE